MKAIDITESVRNALESAAAFDKKRTEEPTLRITRMGDDEPLTLFPIGNMTIAHLKNGKVWLRYAPTGEAGEFSAEDLAAVVERFFWEEF